MLDLIGYTPDKDLSTYVVLEPSFGEGDYLIEIWHRLEASAKKYNFDASEVMSKNIYGCELDPCKYKRCLIDLSSLVPTLKSNGLKNEDFLCSSWDKQFDFIIGNPPYVRYENIPEELIDTYKLKFSTFHYRCDLYVLFYEHCLSLLKKNGIHCFICSNRWLKNEYGRKLRRLISTSYSLDYIIDIENIDAFKESVLAYPAITLITNTDQKKSTHLARVNSISDLKLPLAVSQHKPISSDSWDDLFWTNEIGNLSFIEQEGFKIGIGVATGADKIFISSSLNKFVESELLLPIVTAKDLTGNKFIWKGQYLINPYNPNGSLVDIEDYPRMKQYLEKVKGKLEDRHIVKKGRCWYALIDKIKPFLLNQPKVLLPDISGNKYIFVDRGEFYPAHNIYYITGDSMKDLELLAAILMSKFVKTQIENISNKMNGGFPRWQSRSIRKIRIPKFRNISPDTQSKLLAAYYNQDLMSIDAIVTQIVTSQTSEPKSMRKEFIPPSLFDYDFTESVGSTGLRII